MSANYLRINILTEEGRRGADIDYPLWKGPPTSVTFVREPSESYHSKTEVKGGVIHYSRTFEVKELSVPVSKSEELKKFYRIIATDERNTVVLKQHGK